MKRFRIICKRLKFEAKLTAMLNNPYHKIMQQKSMKELLFYNYTTQHIKL